MIESNGINNNFTEAQNKLSTSYQAKSSFQQLETKSWYEAMSKAWGDSLNNQAAKITELSNQVGANGKDDPASITLLTTESLRMQFLSNSASTTIKSVGQALEALARK
jgi:hypothetical protein